MRRIDSAIALTALSLLAVTGPALAAEFTIAGRRVAPQESNFAGVRHASPRYGLVVQINHDARATGDFELTFNLLEPDPEQLDLFMKDVRPHLKSRGASKGPPNPPALAHAPGDPGRGSTTGSVTGSEQRRP